MSRAKKLLLPLLGVAFAATAQASESGVSPTAQHLFQLGPVPVTNSMVTSWVVALVVVILFRLASRHAALIPSRGQAIVENLVESIRDLIVPIVGSKASKAAFPILIAFFTYILLQNWSGLFPGVGTVYHRDEIGWRQLIRPANADMNGTVALALVAFGLWFYLIMRFAGPALVIKDIFGNKADRKETPVAIYYPLFVIFIGAGLIEIVSIMFRPVSLSFRLFGNVLGGENLIHAMSGMQRWLLPVPFYFLEILIGFVQAFVFTLLVSVHVGLICNHGDEHHGEGHHKEAAH